MVKVRWKRRAAKLRKKKSGMQVHGRSIFTLQELARRKAREVKDRDIRAKDES
jgi:hypothetical protein